MTRKWRTRRVVFALLVLVGIALVAMIGWALSRWLGREPMVCQFIGADSTQVGQAMAESNETETSNDLFSGQC